MGKNRILKIQMLALLLFGSIAIFFVYYTSSQRLLVHTNREEIKIIDGLLRIITSRTALITDFLKVGGIRAAFLNAFLIFLFNFSLVKLLKIRITGIVIASFFTVFGFSFFGKNIFNIIPFYIGGILYSYYDHLEFKDVFISISFASALAPFVSEVAFTVKTDNISYLNPYINAIILGVFIGFIVTPVARKMANFHEGFNLYNLGFTAGILGAVVTSILKLYDFDVPAKNDLSSEYDFILRVICFSFFISLVILGFYINGNSFRCYKGLVKNSGLKADYIKKFGYGPTCINMGINGLIATSFVYAVGGTLNGPFLAGILTVVGFSAYGKNFINIIPILIGVYIAKIGNTTPTFTVILSGLFGTALAPVAGVYGPLWGIIAGWLHLGVVQSIGVVHGGLNLYNNGFSAGIVAGFLLPIMELVRTHKEKTRQYYLKRRKKLYEELSKRISKNDDESHLHEDY